MNKFIPKHKSVYAKEVETQENFIPKIKHPKKEDRETISNEAYRPNVRI